MESHGIREIKRLISIKEKTLASLCKDEEMDSSSLHKVYMQGNTSGLSPEIREVYSSLAALKSAINAVNYLPADKNTWTPEHFLQDKFWDLINTPGFDKISMEDVKRTKKPDGIDAINNQTIVATILFQGVDKYALTPTRAATEETPPSDPEAA